MIQAFGVLLILLGAVAWHVAMSNENPTNINDVWKDILKTIEGRSA